MYFFFTQSDKKGLTDKNIGLACILTQPNLTTDHSRAIFSSLRRQTGFREWYEIISNICNVLWIFGSYGVKILNLDIYIFKFISLLGRDYEKQKLNITKKSFQISKILR